MITRRNLDRFPVFLFDGRSWHFRLGSSRSRHRVVFGRVIETALEMVVMRNRFRTSKRRKFPRRRPQRGIFQPRRFLLTRNEAAFFRVLTAVVADRYLISCKVRLADIITCADRNWRRGHANRIAQKHVDFVVTHASSSRIVAAIELDDRSHLRPDRCLRDAFVNDLFQQMRVLLIRVPASWQYDFDAVARFLGRAGLNLPVLPATARMPGKPQDS